MVPGPAAATMGAVRLNVDHDAGGATIGRRIGAFAIDLGFSAVAWFAIFVVVLIVNSAVGVEEIKTLPQSEQDRLALLASGIAGAVLFFSSWVFTATGGTLGKRILGLRIVGDDLRAPGVGVGLGRTLAAWLSWAPLGLGFLWATWDDRGQTWHDKMASTYVVRADSLARSDRVQTNHGSLH